MTAFRLPLDENWALLHYYGSSGNSLKTFWANLLVPNPRK